MRRFLLPALIALGLVLPTAATGARQNPADALAHLPIEASVYDRATHCSAKSRPGVVKLASWLDANVRGIFWGSYRCEKWGPRAASLHAENRAIDWHLDVADPADAKAARRLLALLLAPDSAGNPQALARRMGVEELIWDCGYWRAGTPAFQPYGPCLDKHGALRPAVDATVAHRDHIHIGMTRAGARGKTSFWRGHTP